VFVIWLLALALGVAGAAYGSRRAVTGALALADELGWSKGLVGVTLVAVGTDLPEIANSISASITGHGDLNVGDGTGSALTQITLILAILALAESTLGSDERRADRRLIVAIGALTVVATVGIAFAVGDGRLGRWEGLLLVSFWAASMIAMNRWQRRDDVAVSKASTGRAAGLGALMGWLGLVAVAATVVVRSFVELTDAIGVPELIASTVILSLGTSLPELVVDWTAIRRGAAALAIGDLFGSSLVDASLSVGIGPIIRSTEVSAAAVTSVLIVAVGVTAATAVWYLRRGPIRRTAWQLLGVYAVCTASMVWWASG
jgi:cation:H+ antiporter